MHTDQWKQIKDVLAEVLAIEPEGRQRFLDESGLSMDVRSEVDSLLRFEDESADLMQVSAVEFSKDFVADDDGSLSGTEIGPYRLIRELGHGGMGAVFLAERIDGKFQQKVALKLLKREMNTSALRRHFEQEREILASLEHPNIARLLDAGMSDDKLPFIAMEYVDGLPIDEYCETRGLDLNARLELFRTVCSAVDFAHRNLVIHRDLKPSNVLVTNDGVPKLLDFGISKIISKEYADADAATITRMGVMTPSYASPEQLRREGVTTLSDVYSLGVVLFELLSGHRPFEDKENDLREIYGAIIEKEPPSPSSMIATGVPSSVVMSDDEKGPSDTKANIGRRTGAAQISLSSQSVRGDLDNIVLKALRKEPERRYSSAGNLSDDIARHIQGLTVTARPNTFSYRASKFVGRNRISVVAAGIVLLAVLAGIATTLWQARVAAAERDRARQQAQKAERINAYMQNILNFNNPHWLSSNPERNLKATVAEAMDEAIKRIDTDLANEPEVEAEILFTLAFSFNNQGQHAKADELLKKSIAKFDQALGPRNVRSMQASVIVADILSMSGKYQESSAKYETAVDYFRTKVIEDRTQSKWLAIAMNDLGSIYNLQGRYQEAEDITQESVEHVMNITGQDRYAVPIVWANLGTIRGDRGDIDAGIDFFNKALNEMKLTGGDQRLEGAIAKMNLGKVYNFKGDYKASERSFLEGQAILEKIVGMDNVFGMFMMFHLTNSYIGQTRYDDALSQIERIDQLQKELFPGGHIVSAYLDQVRGTIQTRTGAIAKGEITLRAALDGVKKSYKDPSQEIALVKHSLGENLIAQKRFDEARLVLTEAVEGYVKTRGPSHPFTKRCDEMLASIP